MAEHSAGILVNIEFKGTQELRPQILTNTPYKTPPGPTGREDRLFFKNLDKIAFDLLEIVFTAKPPQEL
ncbi:hypothetical protein D4L85_03235 [Chryseolinea soli]|uniref:Uncharacterized protein n=1 Tax=Chryseolinea soli TaxID=2321403 RepID=A0A385SGV6_9BACT|nr:hypothetical protein D4L85_03235 [Chryseolinea soli]